MSIVINKEGRFDNSEALDFIDIDSAIDVSQLDDLLDASGVRITFESCGDGRFLTLGRQLRLRGYAGHIRVVGSLLPDQFPMALKLGIDSAEITEAHGARCTEDQWIAHAARTQGNYQSRLAG